LVNYSKFELNWKLLKKLKMLQNAIRQVRIGPGLMWNSQMEKCTAEAIARNTEWRWHPDESDLPGIDSATSWMYIPTQQIRHHGRLYATNPDLKPVIPVAVSDLVDMLKHDLVAGSDVSIFWSGVGSNILWIAITPLPPTYPFGFVYRNRQFIKRPQDAHAAHT
jgi:hypothetical protein